MLNVLKNDFYRLLEKKSYLVVSTVLTVISVIAAIVLTNHVIIKENVAVVTKEAVLESTPYLSFTKVSKLPPTSELVEGKYDAAVVLENGKVVKIVSAKSESESEKVKSLIESPESYLKYQEQDRAVGTNIIGYVMMFLFMQGIIYGKFFGEEKEKHLSERIVVSPIGFYQYAIGHGVFVFGLIFIPTFLVIVLGHIVGVSEGLSIVSFAGSLFVLSALATSFSLFINSLFHESDTANMVGNSVIILTTVLSGSFVSMLRDGSVISNLLRILPQKDFLSFVNDLEKNRLGRESYFELLYVILIVIIFLVAAVVKTRKEYVRCH